MQSCAHPLIITILDLGPVLLLLPAPTGLPVQDEDPGGGGGVRRRTWCCWRETRVRDERGDRTGVHHVFIVMKLLLF